MCTNVHVVTIMLGGSHVLISHKYMLLNFFIIMWNEKITSNLCGALQHFLLSVRPLVVFEIYNIGSMNIKWQLNTQCASGNPYISVLFWYIYIYIYHPPYVTMPHEQMCICLYKFSKEHLFYCTLITMIGIRTHTHIFWTYTYFINTWIYTIRDIHY